jgi:predicted regulator of Ras-like GTPase activity (Roadblock/LC7/MglB family)
MERLEAQRDLRPTAFTEILRRLWRGSEGVSAAVFVDYDGESVDYCSSIDPYEAKVAAATFLPIMRECITICEHLALGTGTFLTVRCDQKEFFVQRISGNYVLVVVAVRPVSDALLRKAMEVTAVQLRAEADMSVPDWQRPI